MAVSADYPTADPKADHGGPLTGVGVRQGSTHVFLQPPLGVPLAGFDRVAAPPGGEPGFGPELCVRGKHTAVTSRRTTPKTPPEAAVPSCKPARTPEEEGAARGGGVAYRGPAFAHWMS